MMKKFKVRSRLIDSVYFSSSEQILKICLAGGGQRIFEDVPEAVVKDMISAASPGQYYLDHIRRKFRRDVP